MRIVVAHLTRMQRGFMCVAGLDPQTGRHVRPVLRRQMRIDLLARHGGPFDVGTIVELGRVKKVGRPPELEDTLFWPDQARALGAMAPDRFWELIEQHAKPKLIEIFGAQLIRRDSGTCALPAGEGHASLGLLRPKSPRLFVEQRESQPRIRLVFHSGEFEFKTPVTDVRLYGADHVTPDAEMVARVDQRLRDADVILSVGLSRQFRKAAADPPLHWLQVNNLHFAENPLWQLG